MGVGLGVGVGGDGVPWVAGRNRLRECKTTGTRAPQSCPVGKELGKPGGQKIRAVGLAVGSLVGLAVGCEVMVGWRVSTLPNVQWILSESYASLPPSGPGTVR